MCGEDKPAASQTSVERSMSWAPRRPSPQFPQFWLGWNIEPPAWDRRSLLTGSSRGGPSRRYSISGNHTLPSHRGAMRSSRTRSWRTLPRTLRSRAIGGNAYRRSLGHLCTIRVQSVQFWCLELTANASRNQYLKILNIYIWVSINDHPYSINCGYLLFFETTIMGNTADLAMVQKTIIDTLHKEGKSQRIITERGGCSMTAVSKHINCKVVWKD